MFTSRLHKTRIQFTLKFKIFAVILALSNITILSIGLPVFIPNTNSPNIIRIFMLFDMFLTTFKVLNIMVEFYLNKVQLNQIMKYCADVFAEKEVKNFENPPKLS